MEWDVGDLEVLAGARCSKNHMIERDMVYSNLWVGLSVLTWACSLGFHVGAP